MALTAAKRQRRDPENESLPSHEHPMPPPSQRSSAELESESAAVTDYLRASERGAARLPEAYRDEAMRCAVGGWEPEPEPDPRRRGGRRP